MTETRVSYAPPGGGVQRYGVAREPPSSGKFFGQTVLVTGGGGIVGHSLIARILREGGSVIAVRAAPRAPRGSRGHDATTPETSEHARAPFRVVRAR